MSLRDELLKVGLINKKQADDADRKLQRQERPPPRHAQGRSGKAPPKTQQHAGGTPPSPSIKANAVAAPKVDPSHSAAAAKLARDMESNRKIQEKAEKKARSAQITQMIQQNRQTLADNAETYNFVDGAKIRRIGVTQAQRADLLSGAVVIVRHEARYDLVPAALIDRLRERDPQLFVVTGVAAGKPIDETYADFPVPDDLQW